MPSLPRGLYEMVLTDLLAERLAGSDPNGDAECEDLRNAEAADRIALHLASVVERAIEAFPERERAKVGVAIARRLIEQVVTESNAGGLIAERPIEPPQLLRAIRGRLPDGGPATIDVPLIPLLDTTLLTNAPGEPHVGSQVLAEVGSADRIDVVMAFIRRSGIVPFRERLQRHVENGRPLRVLTTVYTGSTEAEALELLRKLGADVRVSYDTTGTRLHAKAWLFHRESGFSTAYVGSSNLTHSAQVSGLEWNVRVSEARNRAVIEKISAVFESYWQQQEFEPFDQDVYKRQPAGEADRRVAWIARACLEGGDCFNGAVMRQLRASCGRRGTRHGSVRGARAVCRRHRLEAPRGMRAVSGERRDGNRKRMKGSAGPLWPDKPSNSARFGRNHRP